jgi:cytochrome b561
VTDLNGARAPVVRARVQVAAAGPLNYWGETMGWEGEPLRPRYDRYGESRRRGGAWWSNRFYLWILALAVVGLIVMTPQGRSVLILAAIYLAAVTIHEGGHYLAALRLRYRVSSVRIGPLEITPGYRGWRMALVTVALDGHVEAVPPDHRYAPGREAMFAAAGPLANFAAMFALHGLYLLIAMLPAAGVTMSVRDFVDGCTEGLALWSAGFGVFNLIPFRTRWYPSDGLQLLEIVRRSRRIGRR